MHTRAAALLLLCAIAAAYAEAPRITYRLESDAVLTGPAAGSLVRDFVVDPSIGDWDDTYLQELRIFLKGNASPRARYRIEPRFSYTYHDSIPEGKFDWVIDQAYGSLDLFGRTTLSVGKQRVRWGTGLTFTPTDRWQPAANTLDPTRYLEGTFLFRYDAFFPWISISAIAAPNRPNVEYATERDDVYGLRLFKLIGTIDLYLSATRVLSDDDEETNLGAAFAWDAGPAVIYGEGAALRLEGGTLQHLLNWRLEQKWEPRIVLGLSKQYSTSSAFYVETYYNGWGLNAQDYDNLIDQVRQLEGVLHETPFAPAYVIPLREFMNLLGPARSLHQWYVAGNGTYVYRQLWSLSGNTIVEPVDGTYYLYPIISYLGFENIDFMLGYSSVFGGSNSEKALLPSHHAVDFRFIVYF